jgi:hypothetical protein
MANKKTCGFSPSDSSTTLPLDHVDDDEAWRCRNLVVGVHAFTVCQTHGDGLTRLPLIPVFLPFFFLIKLRHALCFPFLFVFLRPWWPKQDLLEVISGLRLVELYVLVVLAGQAVTVAEEG